MSRAFRLGILIVGGLVVLAVGIFLIGNKSYLFGSTYRLTAEFNDATGLVNGADVLVGGIHEGTVSAINLPQEPGGKVTVIMHMQKATRHLIRQDSTASIKTEGLLGDKYVDVTYGSPSAAAIIDGDTIQGVVPPSLEDQANKATADAEKTMSQIGSAVSTFQDDGEALKHNFLLRGFFKKRGYYDESSLKSDQIARLPGRRPEKEFSLDADKVFDKPGSAQLRDHKALAPVGKFLQQNPFSVAVVSAGAQEGQNQQQRVAAEARAKAARDYLAEEFKLDGSKVKTYGATPGNSPSGKLEIRVYSGEPGSAQTAQNAGG